VKILTACALFQALTVFVVGGARQLDLMQVFLNGFIVIMIGNVPQGLPSTVTACLYIVAERMTSFNVFVKKLDIIETLGSCTLICTDKTGTLTMNLMSVANTWYFNKKHTDTEFIESNESGNNSQQMLTLMDVASLCSRILLEKKTEDSEATPNGDATELGLYKFFGSCIKSRTGMEIEQYRAANPKVNR
jgi:sodium/potassium-transporting ATPase subunit alpha